MTQLDAQYAQLAYFWGSDDYENVKEGTLTPAVILESTWIFFNIGFLVCNM